MNDLLQPQLLKLEKPYPLIAGKGYIYEHLATLLVQNETGAIDSYPIVSDDYFIQGQNNDFFGDDGYADDDPMESYKNLKCNRGDKISWEHFIFIIETLFYQHTDLSVIEIFNDLDIFDVKIANIPDNFNVFVKSFKDGIEIRYLDNMAFKDDLYHFPKLNVDSFIDQLMGYHKIAPHSKINLLSNNKDQEFQKQMQKLQNDFKTKCEEIQLTHQEHLSPCDFLEVAETIQKEQKRTISKNEIIQLVCKKVELDKDCEEQIWDFLANNNLVCKIGRLDEPDEKATFIF